MPFKYFKGCHMEGLICGLIDGFGGRTKARHSESLEGRVLITGRIGAAPRPCMHTCGPARRSAHTTWLGIYRMPSQTKIVQTPRSILMVVKSLSVCVLCNEPA